MSRLRGTRSQRRGDNTSSASVINTQHHVDGNGAVLARISIKQDGTEQVLNKEYHMSGLNSIAPSSPETAAKVTCSFDLSQKVYGNGAGVMCSVTLVVDNNEQAISHAFDLARSICAEEGEVALKVAAETHGRVTHEG